MGTNLHQSQFVGIRAHSSDRVLLSIQPERIYQISRSDSACRVWLQSPAMKYFYGQFDGEEFPTQDKLFGFDQLMDFILQYGDQAMKALQEMMQNPKDPDQSDLLEQMLKDGILDKDAKG